MTDGIKGVTVNNERGEKRKGSEVEIKEKKNKERERIHRKTREISGRNRGLHQ